MFLAATPNSGTSPPAFVRFMTSLYNPTGDGLPDDAEMARSAERSNIPSQVVDRIAAKDTGVDVVKMAEVNNKLLAGAVWYDVAKALRSNNQPPNGDALGVVPTVYDIVHQSVVYADTGNPDSSIGDLDWLNHLMESG
jgi:hypothetical protein